MKCVKTFWTYIIRKTMSKYKDFCGDEEKMSDFRALTKQQFLESYSYLTEEEYNLTRAKVNRNEY